jgi:hypothetical protein
MSAEEFTVWRNIAMIVIILVVLQWMWVTLCLESVKNDLRRRICVPIEVRWRPFDPIRLSCGFKVIYSDWRGRIHRTNCRTFWLSRLVRWRDDEIIGETRESAP